MMKPRRRSMENLYESAKRELDIVEKDKDSESELVIDDQEQKFS